PSPPYETVLLLKSRRKELCDIERAVFAEGNPDAGLLIVTKDVLAMPRAVHPSLDRCLEVVRHVEGVGHIFAKMPPSGMLFQFLSSFLKTIVAKGNALFGYVLAMLSGTTRKLFPLL